MSDDKTGPEFDGPESLSQDVGDYVLCPFCSDFYCAPVRVEVNPGGYPPVAGIAVTSEGTELVPLNIRGRGVSIEIEFLCENGHIFRWRYEFHKGNTTHRVIPIEYDDKRFKGQAVIWRD